MRAIDAHTYKLGGLTFSDCGSWISSVGVIEDKVIRVWDAHSGVLQAETERMKWSLFGHPRFVGTELGTDLLFSLSDGDIHRLEVGGGRMVFVLPGGNGTLWTSAFSTDGLKAIGGYQEHGLRMFDLSARRVLWETQMGPHDPQEVLQETGKRNQAPITCVALSPDDRTAVVGWREELHTPGEKAVLTTKRKGLAVVATDTGRIVRSFSDDVNRPVIRSGTRPLSTLIASFLVARVARS